MRYVIGVDEAGYGPNLGPLVISASVWRISENSVDSRSSALPEVRLPDHEASATCQRSVLGHFADSKQVYHAGGSLGPLETPILAALSLLRRRPGNWRAVWRSLCTDCNAALDEIPWYARYDEPCPVAAVAELVDGLAGQLERQLAAWGVELMALCSRPVFVPEFNRRVAHAPSKAAVLSHLTLSLVARLVDSCCPGPVTIICDKHGGRNRYFELVAEHFPDSFVEIRGESRQQSSYVVQRNGMPIGIRFVVKGERYPAVGLASLASKYLRELALRALNRFWQQHVPGLQPTAGYPVDAQRFARQIAAARERLGIDERLIWRTK